MTPHSMIEHLERRPFNPFVIKMSNGDMFTVQHPELAHVDELGSMYLFRPTFGAGAKFTGLEAIISVPQINSILMAEDAAA